MQDNYSYTATISNCLMLSADYTVDNMPPVNSNSNK